MEQPITRAELNATINEALRLQAEHLLSATSEMLRDRETLIVDQLTDKMRTMESNLLSAVSQTVRERETAVIDQLTETMRTIETNLLTSFHGYARGQTARMHALETTQNDVNIRLAAIEERLLNLETRRNY